MKQNITYNQWNELTDEQKIKWFKIIPHRWSGRKLNFYNSLGLPNIGQLIEFIGIDFYTIHALDGNSFNVETTLNGWIDFTEDDLCDALWEAVKYKIK